MLSYILAVHGLYVAHDLWEGCALRGLQRRIFPRCRVHRVCVLTIGLRRLYHRRGKAWVILRARLCHQHGKAFTLPNLHVGLFRSGIQLWNSGYSSQ